MEENQFSSDSPFKPAEVIYIDSLEMLRTISDALRLQIVEAMIEAPQTVKQVAKSLGMAPAKLYYHIGQLEEFGFIRVVSTRIVSGIIEKQYQARAANFQISRNLLSPLNEQERDVQIESMFSPLFETTLQDIKRSFRAGLIEVPPDGERPQGPNRVMMGRIVTRLTQQKYAEFMSRLDELLKEFGKEEQSDALNSYAATVMIYPMARFTTDDDEETAED